MAERSILDRIIEDRLRTAKSAPDRLKVLENLLENGRLDPRQLQTIHDEVESLRKTLKYRK